MRQTNPWEKFFTRAIIPEAGEVGDAFWGYHVGNNIARLMNVDGTVVFPALTIPTPKFEDYDSRVAYVPTSQLGFHAAPVVQLAVHYSANRSLTTTVGEKTAIYGLTREDVPAYDNPTVIEGDPYTNITIRATGESVPLRWDSEIGGLVVDWTQVEDSFWGMIGSDDEIMLFVVDDIQLDNGYVPPESQDDRRNVYYIVSCTIIRGQYGTDIEEHGDTQQVYRIDPADIAVTSSVQEGHYLLNPPWVQGVLDAQKLTIRWMSKESGTVYFKIFGV